MKYFEVGQTVFCWDELNGLMSGVVTMTDHIGDYPVIVSFDKNTEYSFTIDGRRTKFDSVVLFQTKPIITPNVPIFEERPAYFWSYDNNVWFYDILVSINIDGLGKSKTKECLYDKWQFNAPAL